MTSSRDNGDDQRQRRIRRTALLFGAIALAFYLGFIVITGLGR